MKRRLLNLLTALSLLLCVAACVMWAWSYRAAEQVGCECPAGEVRLRASRGTLLLICETSAAPRPLSLSHSRSAPPVSVGVTFAVALRVGHQSAWYEGVPFRHSGWARGGFRWLVFRRWGSTLYLIAVPFWPLCVALSLVPAGRALAGRRKRRLTAGRRVRGFCPACGYDLRATPDKCPECGHVPAAGAAP